MSKESGFDDLGIVKKNSRIFRDIFLDMSEGCMRYSIGASIIDKQFRTIFRIRRLGSYEALIELKVIALG